MGGRVVKHEAQVLTEKGIKKGIELGRDMERANIEAANKRVEEALKQVNETEQENKKFYLKLKCIKPPDGKLLFGGFLEIEKY